MRLLRLVSSIVGSASFLVTVLGGHHSDPNDEQIIFLLDLMVFEGKEAEAGKNTSMPNQCLKNLCCFQCLYVVSALVQ